MKQKRVLIFEDYSCMGRCSLTVALPILSALGIEAVGVPTAVLSNHTAGFSSWAFADLNDQIVPSVQKWENYNHHFDAIYTGYLANGQVETVKKAIDIVRDPSTFLFVDPAMADGGKLYPGFGESHIAEMKSLLKEADLIVPNVSEAAFLSGIPYEPDTFRKAGYGDLLRGLLAAGAKKVLITGTHETSRKIGMHYLFDKKGEEQSYVTTSYPGKYHGAGDIFASAFLGLLLQGVSFADSLAIASRFVKTAIKDTLGCDQKEVSYGLRYELALPALIRAYQKAIKTNPRR